MKLYCSPVNQDQVQHPLACGLVASCCVSGVVLYDLRMLWKRLRKLKGPYYHLSKADNAASIGEQGITANGDGDIFLFTDMLVADTIAKEQVWIARYVVFEVLPAGIRGRLRRDNVGELSQAYQRILKQPRIEPEYLRLVGTYKIVVDYPTEWDYLWRERLGWPRDLVDEEFAAMRACKAAIAAGVPDAKAHSQLNKRLRQLTKRLQQLHGESK